MSKNQKRGRNSGDPSKEIFDDNVMVDVLGIFSSLRRRKWIIAIITFAGTFAGYLYGGSLIPIYYAHTTLLVEPTQTGIDDFEPTTSGVTTDFNVIATQIRLLQSRSYQARVMEDLGLFEDPDFNAALREPEESLFDKLPLQLPAEPLDLWPIGCQLIGWLHVARPKNRPRCSKAWHHASHANKRSMPSAAT